MHKDEDLNPKTLNLAPERKKKESKLLSFRFNVKEDILFDGIYGILGSQAVQEERENYPEM